MSDFRRAVRERVVVFDGAVGTNLAAAGLTADDYGRPEWEGCHEILSVTRPDVVAALHASFLEAGVDVIETNSFGGFAVPLAEYGLAERSEELCRAAAEIAREVAAGYSTSGHPRWVAGSLGPGTRSPTLGHLRYADLRRAYEAGASGLLAGGVDLLILETAFDLLGLKAGVAGARAAMRAAGNAEGSGQQAPQGQPGFRSSPCPTASASPHRPAAGLCPAISPASFPAWPRPVCSPLPPPPLSSTSVLSLTPVSAVPR